MADRYSGQLPLPLEPVEPQRFRDFCAGQLNIETVHHLIGTARGNGERLVFLWGESGSGKSHLLQAACLEAQAAGLSACYSSWPAFAAAPAGQAEALERYDLWCLDDVGQGGMAHDDEAELALLDLYHRRRDAQLGIIACAGVPPAELPLRLTDLASRLAWGLTLRLRPLDDADKLAALQQRAAYYGFELSDEVGRFLLTHLCRDMAYLCNLLRQLDHATLSAQRKLTVPFLKTYLNYESCVC